MSVEITLSESVTAKGVVYEALTMREPRVRDSLNADKFKGSDGEKEVRMFASLCEVPPEVFYDMTLPDFKKVQDAFSGFFS